MLSPKPIDLLLFEPDRIHSSCVHPRLRLLRNRKPRSARGVIPCESIKCHSIHWTHVKLSFADQPNVTSSKWLSQLDPECVYHTHILWCIYDTDTAVFDHFHPFNISRPPQSPLCYGSPSFSSPQPSP